VGLSAGLIDQRLFSVLVLMALLTTLMTAPLLKLIRLPEEVASSMNDEQASPAGVQT
jgi:hypothetical protein